MSRRILIVDAIPTRRIVMKAKLGAAQYDVVVAADVVEATDCLATGPFDVIFVDADLEGAQGAAAEFCKTLKSAPATQTTPVVMISDTAPEAEIVAAFDAGFDEVIQRPLSERVLLAQLRALMRRGVEQEAGRNSSYLDQLPAAAHTPPAAARLAIVASSLQRARSCAAAVTQNSPAGRVPQMFVQTHASILSALRDSPELDAVLLLADPNREEATLTLLSDLRSRGAASEAGLIISLDANQPTYAARAFDLGADNVVPSETGAEELALRVNRLAQLKFGKDALRRKVRDGLRMAITDPLTGIYNRRFATEKLAQIAGGPDEFAVLMLDLDHFKQINDQHGHAVGDQVLTSIAQSLKSNLRDGDLLARIGGEEFLIALPGASPGQAIGTAERLRRIIDTMKIRAPATSLPVKVTLSIGLVHNNGVAVSIDTLMAKADAALYRAKSHGRNMVSVSKAA